MTADSIEKSYALAKERYAELGVDADAALKRLAGIAISMHCWQGDDVGGFESAGGLTGGGIMATGNYPGKARTADELRADVDKALQPDPRQAPLQPARHLPGDTAARRSSATRSTPEHFQRWIDWAKPNWASAWTSTRPSSRIPRRPTASRCRHRDEGIRQFWVEHGIACRKIGEAIGRRLGTPCVTNVWIPDGYEGRDRSTARARASCSTKSLDEMFAEPIDPTLQPRRRREQAVRHRLGELRGRLARVLPGLRRGRTRSC